MRLEDIPYGGLPDLVAAANWREFCDVCPEDFEDYEPTGDYREPDPPEPEICHQYFDGR